MKRLLLFSISALFLAGVGSAATRDSVGNITLSGTKSFHIEVMERNSRIDSFSIDYVDEAGKEYNVAYVAKDGTITFQGAISPLKFGYLNLYAHSRTTPNERESILSQYLIRQDDQVKIGLTKTPDGKTTATFKGKNSGRFKCRWTLDSVIAVSKDKDKESMGYLDCGSINIAKSIISSFKGEIDSMEREILLADFIGENEEKRRRLLNSRLRRMGVQDSAIELAAFRSSLAEHDSLSDSAKSISKKYLFFLMAAERMLHKQLTGESSNSYGFYVHLRDKYKGCLRERLLYKFCMELPVYSDLYRPISNDISHYILNKHLQKEVNNILNRGENRAAFNFVLPDSAGNRISLLHFRGKAILVDFWFTGCSACRAYYRDVIQYVEQQLKESENIAFISISIDKDREVWKKSLIGNQYTSTSTINLYTDGAGNKHEVIEKFNVIGYPNPVVIDKAGSIVFTRPENLRDKERLVEMLRELSD